MLSNTQGLYMLRALRQFLFPRFCCVCGRRLAVEETCLCESCEHQLPRTRLWMNNVKQQEIYYDRIFHEREELIGTPSQNLSEKERLEENIVAKTTWGRTRVKRVMSYVHYYPHTSYAKIVYDFKYHHAPQLAVEMGRMMATDLLPSGFFNGIDAMVAVPITRGRRLKRGYNQSEKLVEGIRKVTKIAAAEDVLERTQFTISQTRLSHEMRAENIANAFRLKKRAQRYAGKHLLVVDDIFTTGATTIECANVVLQIPDVTVSILTYGLTSKQ